MRISTENRIRQAELLAVAVLVMAAGCAASKERLYPDPGLPHHEVSAIGTHEIYWGPGANGGGPIIESVDGSVVCGSESYCLWYVHVLPGEHVVRVRWNESPEPVMAAGKQIEASAGETEDRRVDIALHTRAGLDYRIDLEQVGEVPDTLAGQLTTRKQYRPSVTILDLLGFSAEVDSGARPFGEYDCACLEDGGAQARGECPRCP